MKNLTLLFCLIICATELLFAQNVGINTSNPHPNALLEIKGSNKGLLIPRGDIFSRTALSSNTAKGLMLCDTMTNTIWMHNGNGLMSGWQSLSIGANYWVQNGVLGTEIKNTNTGGFWSANGSTVSSDPGPVAPPVSGAGTRLMWIPQKSAFRAGTVDNTQWNADSIGTWSASIGVNTVAKGPYSLALGNTTTASGVTATAMGYGTRASGENAISTGSVTTASGIVSTAMGYSSVASGQFSVAIGASVISSNTSSTALGNGTTASGAVSTALGYITTASGESAISMGVSSMASGAVSTAMGNGTNASGLSSTAMGYATKARGENAIAMGSVTVASGANSTSIGFDTYARSYGSVAMGRWNDSLQFSSKTSWLGPDPLLILGNGTSAENRHNAVVVYKNGNVVMKNPTHVLVDPGVLPLPTSGAGTRMMWLPEKSAFRAGTVDNTQWNADSIGVWSASIGVNTVAKGAYSLALGNTTTASGLTSTAMGYSTRASGENAISTGSLTVASGSVSTAMGYSSIASGQFSVAIGGSVIASNTSSMALGYGTKASGIASTALGYTTTASGDGATSMGVSSKASGAFSTAIGNNTIASGLTSTAMGYSTKSSGENAIAMGSVTTAAGDNSTTIGFETYARSYGSVAMGRWNDSIGLSNKTSWLGVDPLLILGNGASADNRHNALVVYKNGNVVFKNPTPVLLDPGTLPVPISGAGTRMMWLPEKSAFRVGTVEGESWNDVSIGTGSFAAGTSNSASGRDATAFGNSTAAYGLSATAMGYGSVAGGTVSTALGFATSATGEWSLSTGTGTKAQGNASTAMGYANTASGNSSTAMGSNTVASGAYSSTMGLNNIGRGFASTVVGMYCDPILAMSQTEATYDAPLFLVGNGIGPGESERRNAMIVRVDGHVGIGTDTPNALMDIDAGPGYLSRGFVVRGDYYVAASGPNFGPGSRMTYYPGKGAFRAGIVGGTQWDDINTGESSVAFGVNTIASGYRSFAAGNNAVASGTGSFALGYYCKALGGSSIALGSFTKAEGSVSSVSGVGTIAKSAMETVIGQYNDTLLLTNPNPLAWELNDALFVVGNGTTPYVGDRHNALVIYKNGNTEVNGNLTIQDTMKISGFTSLGNGAPKIKMKKLTGTSSATQNTSVNVTHGLTMSKIISVDILLSVTGFNLPPSYTYNAGYEYQYYVSTTNIVVINSNGNSGSILTKPFTILITYEE